MTPFWSIQRSDSVYASGTPRWVLCLDKRPAPPEAEPPREFAAVLEELPPPTEKDRLDVAIVDRTAGWQQASCMYTAKALDKWVELPNRGKLELAVGIQAGSVSQLIGLWAGQELAPTLADALHRFYGTLRAEHPVPPAPKPAPPTPEQVAEKKRQAALKEVGCVIAGMKGVALSQDELRLAGRLVAAMETLLA